MTPEAYNILIAGYPYVRERSFAVWRAYPNPNQLKFLLPRLWTAKNGAVVFHPPSDSRVAITRTLFVNSHVPLIGGLLKGWMPAYPLHLWRMRRNIGLVYAASEPTLLTTLWFALFTKLLGKKLVLFSWENISYEEKMRGLSRIVHLALLRLNLALADGIVCGNEEGKRIHRRYTKKPIVVIPLAGVDPEQFKPNLQEREHSPLAGFFVYTFIGALGYRKGLDVLIKAFARVLESTPSAHLVIAGSGEYENGLERAIEEVGIGEHITRFPWLDHHAMVRLLSVSHVFVYPSIPHKGWAEQFGYSMAEASLMELPIISTHSGSIAQVVREGETGILVEPNNDQALTNAMQRLAADEQLRIGMGRTGRAFIIRRYTHTAIARAYTEFFERILNLSL